MIFARRELGTHRVTKFSSVRLWVLLAGTAANCVAFPSPGQAQYVEAAIAVGSTIAGLIAAHNRGDPYGAILKANHALLLVAIAKLDDIQDRLTEVIVVLNNLPGEVDALLMRNSVQELQTDLKASISRYVELMKTPSFIADNSVVLLGGTLHNQVQVQLDDIQKARNRADVKNLNDPATAIIATSLMLVEVNLMNLLQRDQEDIVYVIEGIYMPWFDRIMSTERPDSTFAYIRNASARADQLKADASKNALGKALDWTGKLMACTGVDDTEPARVEFEDDPSGCLGIPSGTPGLGSSTMSADLQPKLSFYSADNVPMTLAEVAARIGQSPADLAEIADNPTTFANTGIVTVQRVCGTRHHIPSVLHARDRLVVSVVLRETEEVVDETPTGVLAWEISKTTDVRGAPGGPGMPADASCEIATVDLGNDAAKRLAHMQKMKRRTDAEASFGALQNILQKINLERLRMAFGAEAMAETQAARQSAENLISLLR